MKNSYFYKKYMILSLSLVIIIMSLFTCFNIRTYHKYQYNYNKKLASIIKMVKTEYPDITERDIVKALNSKSEEDLIRYGIDIKKESLIKENDQLFKRFIFLEAIFFLIAILILLIIFILYNRKKEKDILRVLKYLEEINKKNYHLHMDTISEDNLSLLQNEIYKTMILLREVSENSVKDKESLKVLLEDISHQIKTPLTSISISLDNMLDNKDLKEEERVDFLLKIKREIENINFLAISLLKLSSLDARCVKFHKEKILVSDLIDEVFKNLSVLSDLKEVKLLKKGEDYYLLTDKRWLLEALTNIVKNSLEYSLKHEDVLVNYGSNQVYDYIEIINKGKTINSKDLKHLFERFYKGENASSNSFGIGLSLAKAIVEELGGMISVSSEKEVTTFTIKFYKV